MAKRSRPKLNEAGEVKNNYFTAPKENHSFVSTGCTVLDCALGGGWVLGRMANVVGDKCLSGDTIISAQRNTRPREDNSGPRPKKMTIQTLFNRVHGNHWNKREAGETYLVADVGGHAGIAKMLDVVMSGEKLLYEITNDRGDKIKASEDHKFATPDGWLCLSDHLKVGTLVKCWRGTRDKVEPHRNRRYRSYTSGIIFHPFGQSNVAAGFNYKRLLTARLVIEATINDMTFEEYVSVLRNDPDVAATLQYTNPELEVHHLDGDCGNDRIGNLVLIPPPDHWAAHAQEMPSHTKAIELSEIVSICKLGKEPTFDITMEAPHHNFIANGFVVHNSTAKTALGTEALINFMRQYPNGVAAYRDTEAAFDQGYAEAMGLPLEEVDFGDIENPIITVEDFYRDFEAFLDAQIESGTPGIYVLDSLDALSDDAEMDSDIDKGSYGTGKAKMLSKLFRKLTRKIERSKVLLLVVSQIRQNINATAFGEKYIRSGGKSLDFYASQIVWLAHVGALKKTINKVERVYGVSILAKVKKNKVGIAHREAKFPFIFGYGVDDLKTSLDWLKTVYRSNEATVGLGDVDNLDDATYQALQTEVAATVIRVWAEVETTFLPTRRKYL